MVILAIMLALALPMVAAAAPGQAPEREVDQARRIGQAWVDRVAVTDAVFSEWQGAHLTSPQPYYNPKGEVIAYMFAIEKNGKIVGRVLVGSSAYGFPIFEAGKAPPFLVPPAGEVSSILRREHGLQIPEVRVGEPVLLLVNILRGFYTVWEVEGRLAGINLVSRDSFVVSRLEDIRSSMPSPQEYKAAKRATSQSAPGMALPTANWGSGEIPHADQMKGDWPDPSVSGFVPRYPRPWYCGPASATTIALWKRDFDGDVRFPPTQDGRRDITKIFDGFDHWNMHEVTMWWAWRSGFLGYARGTGGNLLIWYGVAPTGR